MALTSDQSVQTVRDLLVAVTSDGSPFNLAKPDVQAAIVAVDAWVSSNSASYNSALPGNFRTQATAAEKALLLAYVCLRRASK